MLIFLRQLEMVIFVFQAKFRQRKQKKRRTASDTSNDSTDKVLVLKIVHSVVTGEMHIFLCVGLSHSA